MTEIKENNVCQSGEWVPENRFRRSWAKLKRNKAALAGGVLGLDYPKSGAFVCLITTISLLGEATGRFGLLRFWIGKWH